eukprot:12588609-Alexandrium_andersonii.AAC.1
MEAGRRARPQTRTAHPPEAWRGRPQTRAPRPPVPGLASLLRYSTGSRWRRQTGRPTELHPAALRLQTTHG